MMQQQTMATADYHYLLREAIPLIDVRAPVEFQQGAMPAAVNLPLMDNDERAAIGTCYKQQGRRAARELGYQRVSGSVRTQRINAWLSACQRYPQGYIYCARGGLRSHIVQDWLHEAGIDYPLVTGGYKAMRQAVMQVIEQLARHPMVLIGGCTGSGKTSLLQQLPCGIDLEALARHRGSSFGRTVQPQLSQASFENLLAATMLQINDRHPVNHWVLEDESRAIGANHIPESLHQRMLDSPIVVVEEPFARRLQRLRTEYFEQSLADFHTCYGDESGWQYYAGWLHHGLHTIRRRLGLARYDACRQHLEQALRIQQQTGDSEAHFSWLVPLLEHYYDPMYRYQLAKKQHNIVFRGDYQQVTDWLMKYCATSLLEIP